MARWEFLFRWKYLQTHDKSPRIQRETIILLQSWLCWEMSYHATKLHFCESPAKVCENTVSEPVVKPFNNTFSMNIGTLSRIWHLPARQTLPRSGFGGFSRLYYSRWLALQQLWPQPNGLQEEQCLKAWSVRGTPISKSWSAPWWK